MYVGNLSYDTPDEIIWGAFEPFGEATQQEISKVRIVASPESLVLPECPCSPGLRAMTSSNSKHTEWGQSSV
jgi:hypothetical protein